MRTLRPLLPALALLGACTLDAPQQYLVRDARILAIRASIPPSSQADAGPLDTVRLEALVANPRRPSATVTVDWYACAPVSGNGLSSCVDPQRLAAPATFPSHADVFTLGAGTGVDVPLALLSAIVDPALAAVVDAATADPALRCALYVEVPVVAILRADDVTEVAVKRVRITPAVSGTPLEGYYVVNVNPALSGVFVNPTDEASCTGGTAIADPLPAGAFTLCGITAAGSDQGFNQCQPGGGLLGVREELEWQWYVSAGEFTGADFSGNATGGHVELKPAGPFTLWVIVRDGRGGTDWAPPLSLGNP